MDFVSVQQMRSVEQTLFRAGIPYDSMIEKAAQGVCDVVVEILKERTDTIQIFALVGNGNNGADTLLALSKLQGAGYATSAWIPDMRRDEHDALICAYINGGGKIHRSFADATKDMRGCAVFIDGLLGIGTHLPLSETLHAILSQCTKTLNRSRQKIVAVDCPSGVDCESGECAPCSLQADITVTFRSIKAGMLQFPAFEKCGTLIIKPIAENEADFCFEKMGVVLDMEWAKQHLPHRPLQSNKGTFGKVTVIGGCKKYRSAPALSALSAYRSGCGLVQMVVPDAIVPSIAQFVPEVIFSEHDLYSPLCFDELFNDVKERDVFLIGPGLDTGDKQTNLVSKIISFFEQKERANPLILDADGLNTLLRIDHWQSRTRKNWILTPHPGEMARLTNLSVAEVQSDRLNIAAHFAQEWGVIIVLKGAVSLVACPDGTMFAMPFASSALAKGGTGDVLAGLIAGFAAQGVIPEVAAGLGVWVHATATQLAQRDISTYSLLASDLTRYVSHVLLQLEKNLSVG